MADTLVRVVDGRAVVVPFGAELLTPLVAQAQAAADAVADFADIYLPNKELFDPATVTEGTEVYGDGTLSPQADSSISALIDVHGEGAVKVSLLANPGSNRFYTFYAQDGTTIIAYGFLPDGQNEKTIIVPSNAYWFRISPKQRYAAGGTDYDSVRVTTQTIFVLFGDSITETDGPRANWPDVAMPLLGADAVYNYGTSGAHFSSNAALTTYQKFENQIAKAITDGRPAKFIVVALGTNDYGNSTGVGGIIDLGDYATAIGKATGSLDRTVSLEGMRAGFRDIKAQWPNAKVFVSLPIQRDDFTKESMTAWLADIRAMAGRYGFQVVDAHNDSGISSEMETGTGPDLLDGIHPNAWGIRKIGLYLAAALRPHVFV